MPDVGAGDSGRRERWQYLNQPEALRRRAQDYLVLTDRMVLALSDLFESIAEDPTAWAQDVRRFLPPWLIEVPA